MSDTPTPSIAPLLDDYAMNRAADGIRQGLDAESVCKLIRDTYEAELQELRAQLAAQEWEPLPNGKHDKIAGRTSIEIRADMIILENRDSILTAVLPDNLRLCRRKAQD